MIDISINNNCGSVRRGGGEGIVIHIISNRNIPEIQISNEIEILRRSIVIESIYRFIEIYVIRT